MKTKALIIFALLALQIPVFAQAYQKIADDSFGFIKAGTFAKPGVSKRTNKLALAQVRVHYKFVTTQMAQANDNSARVSVYLDGGMTEQDLQNLTNEFYQNLQRKLGALGIEFVDWNAIQGTEYYKDREAATDDKKTTNGDVKSGQGWLSYTGFDGPVFMRYGVSDQIPEIIAYGKAKKIMKMCESLGADFATFDAVVDFSSINLGTNVGTEWVGMDKYLKYSANLNVAPIISIPQSYITFLDEKAKYDGYNSKLPVVTRDFFAAKPYQDAGKAALMTRFFGNTKFTFTPVVIPAERELYLAAVRSALNLYADLFVEKLRLIRGQAAPQTATGNQNTNNQNNSSAVNQAPVKSIEERKKNNEATPVTYGEFMNEGKQALAQKDYATAEQRFSEAIKISPNEIEAYLQLADTHAALGKEDAMMKDYEQILKLDPNNGLIYYNRGTIYFTKKNDYKKAVNDFNRAIQLMPNYVDAYINRGLSLTGLKKFDEAEQDLQTAIRLSPNNPTVYRARAAFYKFQGKTTLAQADELKAAQLERGQ